MDAFRRFAAFATGAGVGNSDGAVNVPLRPSAPAQPETRPSIPEQARVADAQRALEQGSSSAPVRPLDPPQHPPDPIAPPSASVAQHPPAPPPRPEPGPSVVAPSVDEQARNLHAHARRSLPAGASASEEPLLCSPCAPLPAPSAAQPSAPPTSSPPQTPKAKTGAPSSPAARSSRGLGAARATGRVYIPVHSFLC